MEYIERLEARVRVLERERGVYHQMVAANCYACVKAIEEQLRQELAT